MALAGYLLIGFIILIWVIAAFYFLRSSYHFMKMRNHMRSDKHEKIATFLIPWMTPFLPALYTEEGNYHRQLSGKYFRVALVFMAIFAGTILFLEHAG